MARQVEKVHPMANHLGTVKDMEEFKQQIQKQKRQFNKAKKEFLKYYPAEDAEILEIEHVPVVEIIKEEQPKPIRERKQTPREQQMNRPIFDSNYEKYEWLMNNGCTNSEDRKWLADYIRSDEWPGQMLQVEGQLAASVNTQYDNNSAVIGSNKDYAAIHQLGGKAGRNKKVSIPARPYLKLTDEDFDEILDATENYLKD